MAKRIGIIALALLCEVCAVHSKASSTSADEPPVVTKAFYDPNYHDDGFNHLRGPTAASSSNTISVISPQAAASTTREAYLKPGSSSIMAIVDHFYGPNGEEQVKYSSPSQMDKSEIEQILSAIGSTGSKVTYDSPSQPSTSGISYSPYSSSYGKPSSMPEKYVKAPLSSLYKSSSSPSYASAAPSTPGYSLSSLYKTSSDSLYSKPSTSNRPAYSTIYKDPQYNSYQSKPATHYSKGSSEFSMPSYQKEPVLIHSPKETSYYKTSPYFSTESHPKSISDAILGDSYSKGYAPAKGIANVIEQEDSYSYVPSSPSYSQGPSVMSHPPSHHDISGGFGGSSEYSLSGGKLYSSPLKAGLHSLPVKYSGAEYMSSPPSYPHEMYSPGVGYSIEEAGSPYTYGGNKGYMKRPPTTMYTTSPSTPAGGHSLSSLYEPLAFDELYNSPKAKTVYSSPGMPLSKPGYGHSPGAYMLSYGPPVEYNMPPKGHPYTTSSSPYASPALGGPSPRYKGPYRTVNTSPMGYASHIGYGYGKPHSHHGNLLASSSNILSDMLQWYKTRGGGWARRPAMMKPTPYYKYKYSTLSHSTAQLRPMYENGASEKFYHYIRPNPYGPFGRFPFHF